MLKSWNNVTLDERSNLVFEGRNQNYGAYELRTNYNKRVTYIVGGMILFSLALLGVKKIADRPKEEVVEEVLKVEQIDLTPPPPVDEQPPPPPPPPPPPQVENGEVSPSPNKKKPVLKKTPEIKE